jgi:hypothetical protein
MGDIGESDNGCGTLSRLIEGFIIGLFVAFAFKVLCSAGDGADRLLTTTGSSVRRVKNTNLAIRTGSLNNDVKLSPPYSVVEPV